MPSPSAIRKRLAALREAVRAPLRPGGQSEGIVRALERMKTAKQYAEEQDATAYRLRLSPLAVFLSVIVMGAAIVWSYFMGYMIGLGENPARQLASLTGGSSSTAQEASRAASSTPMPHGVIKDDIAPEEENAEEKGTPPSPSPPEHKDKTAPPQAYPFAKPQGSGLAAWGNASTQQTPATSTVKPPKEASPPTASAPPPAAQETLYDFVFQVASFKNQDDADRLCVRLEGQGFRCRTQRSGSFHIVLSMLRGTVVQGAERREAFQRMGLGVPLQKSRTPVKKTP